MSGTDDNFLNVYSRACVTVENNTNKLLSLNILYQMLAAEICMCFPPWFDRRGLAVIDAEAAIDPLIYHTPPTRDATTDPSTSTTTRTTRAAQLCCRQVANSGGGGCRQCCVPQVHLALHPLNLSYVYRRWWQPCGFRVISSTFCVFLSRSRSSA